MDEGLDDVLLVSAHDYASDLSVVRLWPEVSWVGWITPVFERNEVVLLVAGHVVGMRQAPGGIDPPGAWVDKLRSCLVHPVPIFPKLLSLQLARVSCRGSDKLRAPMAIADGVPDVPLRDLRVRRSWSPRRVRIDFRRADAAGLARGRLRQK